MCKQPAACLIFTAATVPLLTQSYIIRPFWQQCHGVLCGILLVWCPMLLTSRLNLTGGQQVYLYQSQYHSPQTTCMALRNRIYTNILPAVLLHMPRSGACRTADASTRWAMFKPAAPGTLWAYQFAPGQVRGLWHCCFTVKCGPAIHCSDELRCCNACLRSAIHCVELLGEEATP